MGALQFKRTGDGYYMSTNGRFELERRPNREWNIFFLETPGSVAGREWIGTVDTYREAKEEANDEAQRLRRLGII